jgi:amino acid adenylation domain-containing protein
MTYGELEVRANRLAHHLRELGVTADARVGICLEHTPEMAVAVYGVLKAGGAYVGLDPEMPADRLGWVLADAGACALITTASLRGRLPAHPGLPVVDLDAQRSDLAHGPGHRPSPWAGPENLVYLIYTSGSTGRPKGVLTEHRQLLSYLRGILVPLAPRPGDTWALHQQLAVDAPVTYLFAALVSGGVLHLMTRDRVAQPEALGAYFVEHGIDFFKAAPSHFAALLNSREPARVLPRRLLMLGGEASRRDWIRELRTLAPGCVLLNHYGPTETTVGVLTWPADEPGLSAAPPTLPLGRPLAGARTHVLDPWLDPAPVGVPGELYIGGSSLARGYRLRPDLTAERFVPDPFAPEPGARLYRTGDVVRRLPDGMPEFLGRADHQVKIRGFRIELEEVEGVLAEHPGVRTCAVDVREDVTVGRHLVAWVAPAGVPAPAAVELRSFLQDRLPAYMVPAVFVLLSELPRTPQGKVDRKALPAPATASAEEPAAGDVPRTPAEELMAGLWAEVLGLRRVGLHEDFFELRGHTLLAAQIVARVRSAFGVDLPLRALFEHPTVAGLLAAIEEARGGAVAPPLRPVPRTTPLPLSFAQQRLWFLDQLEPGSWAYNVSRGVRLRGALDRRALHRALTAVVCRHEILRTRYTASEGEPVQVIDPAGEVPLPLVDLTALPVAAREAEIDRVVVCESRSPFDLARGPVLRATLVRLGEAEHAALFTVHHIACDGWSLRLLERELAVLYGAFLRGAPSPLAELPVQYADFAAWERGWLQGEVLAQHLGWWRRLLGGPLPPLDLPADRPRPERVTGRGGRRAFRLDGALAERLRSLGRQEGATLFMVLLAGFATLLYRIGRQDDLVIGADVTNRSRRETEGLIGFFINMLALRLDLGGNPPFRKLLARVREVSLGAYAHQDLPFEKLVEEVQPQRAAGHSPLFRVVFNFNSGVRQEEDGDAAEGPDLPGLEARPLAFEYETVRFDLTLLMSEAEDGLSASWTYSVDLWDDDTVVRLHRRFETLLASAVERPDLRLDALEIVGAGEQEEEAERQRRREEAQRGKLLGLRARRTHR